MFTPNRLPQADNRWTILPEDVLRQIEEVTGFEPPILLERNLPKDEIQNVQAGLRLRSSSLIDGWDLELSAFHGHDTFGLFDAALLFPPVRIEVEQIYPEYNEVGGGFSTAAGGFTIHAEAAYHRTVGSIDDDYWQYVAGFDYVIDSGIPAALDRIQFGVEYAGEGVDNENTRPISTFSTGFNRALVNSAAALVDFVFSEETSVRGGGGINFNDDDFVVRAEITHKLIENLSCARGSRSSGSRDDLLRHLGRERPSVRVHDLLLLRRPAMHHRGRRRIDSAAHWTASVAAALLAIALAAPAGAQSGLEIMKEQQRRHQAKSEELRVKVTLVDKTGKEKEREIQILSNTDQAGLSKVLIKFVAPANIRNTGLLTWEQPGDKEDDQWLYLPSLPKEKRIASSGKKGSFMNTDLAFEDLRPEDLDAHTYKVLREEDLGGQKCWVIEALPSTDKEKLESGYGKRVFWVRKDLYLTVQTEFYDKSDKLSKRQTFSDLVNVGGEMWRAKGMRMETLDRKTASVLTTIEDKVNEKIDESLLTVPGLTDN